jgi:aminotransferase
MMDKYLSDVAKNYPASGIRRMFDIALGYKDAINLTLGEPNFDTPPHIRESAKKALDEGYTRYCPNAGMPALREVIAERFSKQYGFKRSMENVMVTVGAMEALTISLLATVNPGEEVLVPDPCFPNYWGELTIAKAVPVSVPVYEDNGFVIKAADIEKAITPKTKGIILNSPSNPLGSVIDKGELLEIAKIVKKHGLLVYSDEVYNRLLFDGQEYFSLSEVPEVREQVMVIDSFSKTFAMTGWRIGFVVADAALIAPLPRIQEGIVSNVSTFTQKAAIEAVTGDNSFFPKMLADYQRRRDLLVRSLNEIPGIKCAMPRGSFYAFPSIKALGVSSQQFAEDLVAKAGVVVVPGSAFGKMGEGYFRAVFANSDENIAEAVKRIGAYVRKTF